MAEFPNRQRCRFYIDIITKEVRHYIRMLSQFFRRILGIGVRKEEDFYDDDISSCESQYTLSSLTESLPHPIVTANDQRAYSNFEAQQFDDVNECLVNNEICEEESVCDSADEASSSIIVNFDHPEIEARAGNELSEFSGIEILEDETDDFENNEKTGTSLDSVLGPQTLSPRAYPLPVSSSSEDSIPEWDWGKFPDEYPPDVLKIYIEMLESVRSDPHLSEFTALQTPESFEAYRKIIEAQYKAFMLSGKDFRNKSAAEYKQSGKTSAGSTPKHSRKHSSVEKVEDGSSENEVCVGQVKVDLSHSDLGTDSDLNSSGVSVSSARGKDVRCNEDNPTICCSCRKDYNLMPGDSPFEDLDSLTEDEKIEAILEMRRQKELMSKDETRQNEPNLLNDENEMSNDSFSIQLQPDLQVRPKIQPLFIRGPSFRFKPDIRTKDKYTYTDESYVSLSACKLLKCKTGRFLHDYGVDIAEEIRTLRGRTRPVMAISARPVAPDFDLSCLYSEPSQVFLYDAPSAFERAAYRMDDHIVPGQGTRKKISPTETSKPKVKRRGIPNKHLTKNTRGNEYLIGYEEEGVVGEDEMSILEEEEEPAVTVFEATEPDMEPKRLSPHMDFRHFEGVPVAVVQKKKGAQDDVEFSAVKRKKNKNKKKQQKEAKNKNLLLDFDHGERPRARGRYN